MIIHICSINLWEAAKRLGYYEAESLKSQGFIHCSKPEQVVKVANFNFKGTEDLLLLLIDEQKIKSEIKYEDGGSGELYPHIYGPIDIVAVENTVAFPPDTDGTFKLPELPN